jgi:hypothetical protein
LRFFLGFQGMNFGKMPEILSPIRALGRNSLPRNSPRTESTKCKFSSVKPSDFSLRILTDAPSVFSGIAVFPLRRKMMTLDLAEGLHAASGASARLRELEDTP